MQVQLHCLHAIDSWIPIVAYMQLCYSASLQAHYAHSRLRWLGKVSGLFRQSQIDDQPRGRAIRATGTLVLYYLSRLVSLWSFMELEPLM